MHKLIIIHSKGKENIVHELTNELVEKNWHVLATHDIAHASEFIDTHRLTVGLIYIDDAKNLLALEDIILANSLVEWIAIVPPHALAQTDVRQMIWALCHDYHTLPLDRHRLLIALGHAHGKASLRKQSLTSDTNQHAMVGTCHAMQQLFEHIEKIGNSQAPVLITGESGTGKELAARAIHQHSDRAQKPFVAVNCAALPSNLIYSELFGHEKGAFTGAHQRKIGLIESAAGGTIFFDEIGDLQLELQVNLLRFLQNKFIERLGASSETHIDVRVIAATNIDLEKAVQTGHFREDLYYRLNVLRIKMPTLREREHDIDLLAETFFKQFSKGNKCRAKGFSPRAIFAMRSYHWPGNVRELMNRVNSAIIMSENRLISVADLGLEKPIVTLNSKKLNHARNQAEHEMIRNALRYNNNNVSQSAKQLGISRATLYRLMSKLSEVQTC